MAGAAARVNDPTYHIPGVPIGTITGPGVASVQIARGTAAVMGDIHQCNAPQPAPPHSPTSPTPTAIVTGSLSVRIGGRPAARTGDSAACGATIMTGAPGVSIGD